MTYWLINLPFLAAATMIMMLLTPRARWKVMPIGMLPLLAMTAVFDNLIVGLGIVDYDPTKISGLRIGFVPIEDFAYAIAAVLLVPSIWIYLGRKEGKK